MTGGCHLSAQRALTDVHRDSGWLQYLWLSVAPSGQPDALHQYAVRRRRICCHRYLGAHRILRGSNSIHNAVVAEPTRLADYNGGRNPEVQAIQGRGWPRCLRMRFGADTTSRFICTLPARATPCRSPTTRDLTNERCHRVWRWSEADRHGLELSSWPIFGTGVQRVQKRRCPLSEHE